MDSDDNDVMSLGPPSPFMDGTIEDEGLKPQFHFCTRESFEDASTEYNILLIVEYNQTKIYPQGVATGIRGGYKFEKLMHLILNAHEKLLPYAAKHLKSFQAKAKMAPRFVDGPEAGHLAHSVHIRCIHPATRLIYGNVAPVNILSTAGMAHLCFFYCEGKPTVPIVLTIEEKIEPNRPGFHNPQSVPLPSRSWPTNSSSASVGITRYEQPKPTGSNLERAKELERRAKEREKRHQESNYDYRSYDYVRTNDDRKRQSSDGPADNSRTRPRSPNWDAAPYEIEKVEKEKPKPTVVSENNQEPMTMNLLQEIFKQLKQVTENQAPKLAQVDPIPPTPPLPTKNSGHGNKEVNGQLPSAKTPEVQVMTQAPPGLPHPAVQGLVDTANALINQMPAAALQLPSSSAQDNNKTDQTKASKTANENRGDGSPTTNPTFKTVKKARIHPQEHK